MRNIHDNIAQNDKYNQKTSSLNKSNIQYQKENPLFELQQTLYHSENYTRRRLHRIRFEWVVNAISKYSFNLPADKAIEYGPGSRIYLPILARSFKSIVAADIEHSYLSGLRTLTEAISGLSLVVDDILKPQLPKNNYGLVLCSEVLEHIKKPEKGINTLFRILKPGGIAIITTPQRYSILELFCKVAFLPGIIKLVRKIYQEPVLKSGHIGLRSKHSFRHALIQGGFEIVEEDRFGLYVPLLAEFGGVDGGRFIDHLEGLFKNSFLEGLFWTQAYVLIKPINQKDYS